MAVDLSTGLVDGLHRCPAELELAPRLQSHALPLVGDADVSEGDGWHEEGRGESFQATTDVKTFS